MTLDVKVIVVDTVFTTIPVGTKIADIVITGSVDPAITIYSTNYMVTKTEVTAAVEITTTNLTAIHFEVNDRQSGDTVIIDKVYPKMVSKELNKFNKPNMVYKITKDIDLNHCVLTIPVGCTLDFQGGTFSNGTIKINSGCNVYLNGGTLTNCCLDLSNNDRIVQDVTISNGKLKISGIITAIKAVNDSRKFYSLDIRIENVWIEGDTDNSFSSNINKCKGIHFNNSWINYLHNVKILHCGTALTIENANDIKCSQCTFRWNGLHILHTSGGSNVFQNGDMEQGFHMIDIYNGDLKLLNSYIEAHTDGRGINIRGGKFTIKDSHLLSIYLGVYAKCTLIVKDNIFDFQGSSSKTWYGITLLNDVDMYLVLENNDFTEDSPYLLRVSTSYDPLYFNGTSFINVTTSKSKIALHKIDVNGYVADIVYDNTTLQRVKSLVDLGMYHRVAAVPGDVTLSDTSPNGTLMINDLQNNKPNLVYKNAQGHNSALDIATGLFASMQNLPNVKAGFYYATDTNVMYSWNGVIWIPLVMLLSGPSNSRPSKYIEGSIYFDTTLKKYICWNGTSWVNMDGTPLT